MPLAGLLCPQHGELLDSDDAICAHFGLDDCLHVPRAQALYVYHANDKRPVGVDKWSTTEVIDHSIRRQMLQKCIDYYVDPVKHMSMMTGQAVHKLFEGFDNWSRDGADFKRFYGTLGGFNISGETDVRGRRTLGDYKWTGSLRWLNEAKFPHILQLSIYASLLRQNGQDYDKGVIYYGGFGQQLKAFRVNLLTDSAILDANVNEKGESVRQNIEAVKAWDGTKDNIYGVCGCDWMHFGKEKASVKYCDVVEECRELCPLK